VKVLHANSSDALKGKRVAILGYGNQGRAQALNLRDSGVDLVIGQRPGASYERAVEDGMAVHSVAEASSSDVLMLTLPDESAADTFQAEVVEHLEPGRTLLFTHGFNIHFGFIQPPSFVKVPAPHLPQHFWFSCHCASARA